MDDGSTDETKDEIQKHFGSDSSVKYFYQENQERGVARNNGFNNAAGEYVVFFDSDDILHSSHLSTLHKGIMANPGVNFIASKYDFIRNG